MAEESKYNEEDLQGLILAFLRTGPRSENEIINEKSILASIVALPEHKSHIINRHLRQLLQQGKITLTGETYALTPSSSNVRAPFDRFLEEAEKEIEKAEKEIDDNVKRVLSWHDDLLGELEGQADDIIPNVPPDHKFPSATVENVENDDILDIVLENAYFEEAEIAFDNSQQASAVPSGTVSRTASGVTSMNIAKQKQFAEQVRSALSPIAEGKFKIPNALKALEALEPVREEEPRRSGRISAAQAVAAAKKALETAIELGKAEDAKALLLKKKALPPPPRTPAVSRRERARLPIPEVVQTPGGVRRGLTSLDSSDQQVRSIYGYKFFNNVYTNVYTDGKLRKPPTCWLCGLQIRFKSQLQYEHILRFATAACMGLLFNAGLGLNDMQKIVMQSLGECSHAECNGKGSGDTRKAKGDIKLIDYGVGPGWTTLRPDVFNIEVMLVGHSTVPTSADRSIYQACLNSNNSVFSKEFRDHYRSSDQFMKERRPIVAARVGQLCIMVRDYVDYNLFNRAKANLAGLIAGQTPADVKRMKDQLLTGIYTDWPLAGVVAQPLMVYEQGMYINPELDPSLPITDLKYTWRNLGLSYGFAKCLANIGLRPGGLAGPPPANIVFGPNAFGANFIGGSVSSTRRHRTAQQKKLRTQKRRRVTTEIVPYQP